MNEFASVDEPTKRVRALELALVLFVAFAGRIYDAAYHFIFPATGYGVSTEALIINTVIVQLAALALLVYVLYRQQRSLSNIGFAFSWRDVYRSLLLCAAAYAAFVLSHYATSYAYFFTFKQALANKHVPIAVFDSGVTLLSFFFVLLNPFYEELLARAYTISEVAWLTQSSAVAVIASVALQTAYHIYQGAFPAWRLAWVFLIFSLYYAKRRRIMPVILAHLYLDVGALMFYVRH